jgi:hypothetical protein
MQTLDQVVASTVRRYKGEVEELADYLGIKPGTLYRLSNPLDEEARINSKHLIPLMEKTKDYSILKHIAWRLGFILVRLPRVRTAKVEELAVFQQAQAEAMRMLAGFFAGGRDADSTLAAVRLEMEKAAGMAKAVEAWPAPGLFEEEP